MKTQQLEWNDLSLVLAICRSGTLSGAAQILGVNHSTVFRRIGAIEDKLGVRLFDRLPNGYAMTEAGEAVREVSERIENEISALSRKLIGRDLQLHGILRVSAPDALAIEVLMPHMATFCQAYPTIQLELSVANSFVDLAQREADVAIRSTKQPPETAVGHRLCRMMTSVYGSSSYINDNASNNLERYHWLMPNLGLDWFSANKWLNKHYPESTVVFRSNSLLGLYKGTKQGLGVAPLPCFLADPDDDLLRTLAPVDALSTELWLLIHPDLRRTARVRAFVDFLLEAMEKEKDLIEGVGNSANQ